MSYTVEKLGWLRQLPDTHDLKFLAPHVAKLPQNLDMTSQCPGVYDQGPYGSCTSQAVCFLDEFNRMKQQLSMWVPSRMFHYYNERARIHTTGYDSGAYLRDGMKTLQKQGVCPETDWPYTDHNLLAKPPKTVYAEAKPYESLVYKAVQQNAQQIKGTLVAGYPVVFGFTVYQSFMNADVQATGTVPMPGPNENVLGGHAVALIGYDDSTQRFLCRNSWGVGWGAKGYFTMPYAYVVSPDLSSDFWVVTSMSPTP